jgi:hypothetical protein
MYRSGDCTWKCQTKSSLDERSNGSRLRRHRVDGTDCFSITSCRQTRELISTFWWVKAERKFRGIPIEGGATGDSARRTEVGGHPRLLCEKDVKGKHRTEVTEATEGKLVRELQLRESAERKLLWNLPARQLVGCSWLLNLTSSFAALF